MIITLVALALVAQQPAPAPAPVSPSAQARGKFGPASTFKEMLADPKARAILQTHIPLIVQVIDEGLTHDRGTLKEVSENESARTLGEFTPEAYQAILADFARL